VSTSRHPILLLKVYRYVRYIAPGGCPRLDLLIAPEFLDCAIREMEQAVADLKAIRDAHEGPTDR